MSILQKQPRIFTDRHTLNSMLKLRKAGFTYKSLAFIFNVDHSSIYHHCVLSNTFTFKKKLMIDISSLISPYFINPTQIISLVDIRKKEKTYQDYLNDEKNRHSKVRI